MKPALPWSELIIGARQPTDAVDRVVVSPYLSFKERPMPLMMIKMMMMMMMMMMMIKMMMIKMFPRYEIELTPG